MSALGFLPPAMSPRDILVAAALLLMVLTGAAGGWHIPGSDSLGLSTASAEAAPEEPTATASATRSVTATPPLVRETPPSTRVSTANHLIFKSSATGTPAVTLSTAS